MAHVLSVDFVSFAKSTFEILEKSCLKKLIKNQRKIILKPNLTTNLPPPCTTPVELLEEVIKYCQKYSPAEIIVAEGSGGHDTLQTFKDLGYDYLTNKFHVQLIDLNREQRIEKENPSARALKKVKLPKIIFGGFFINLPVLKQHDEGIITCAAKNLFGIYLNSGIIKHFLPNWWNKSELHYKYGVQNSIFDLNLYRPSDFILVDASVGQTGNEIHGQPCNPPIKKLFAGFDNLEVDRYCAPFLNLDPNQIPYLNL